MIEAMTMAKFSSCRYFVLFFTSPSKKNKTKQNEREKKTTKKKLRASVRLVLATTVLLELNFVKHTEIF